MEQIRYDKHEVRKMIEAVKHYINIDVLAEKSSRVCYIRRTDIGHEMHISVRAGGRPITLPVAADGIVQFVYEKPDGTKSDCMTEVIGNEAVFMLPRAAVDVEGEVPCEIRVYVSAAAGTYYTTPKMMLVVQDVIYNAEAQQEIESDPTVYEEILSSEAGRVLAEQGRESAETARALAEEARAAAETARVLAEEARAAAEEARIASGAITRADVDSALSGTSVNPVQNKAIYYALQNKQDTLTFDDEPTEGSTRPVKSGGIYTALQGKQDTLEWDTTPTQDSIKPVTSGGIYTALQAGSSVKTGSFTLRFTEQSGSYIFVKQIGNVVYIYGMISSTGTLADASSHHLGDITGVDGPARTISLPVWTTSDAETWTPGVITLAEVSGSIYVGMGVKETDSSMLINAFYTV